MSNIKIIKVFNDFGYYQPQITLKGTSKVKSEVQFSGEPCQTIRINNEYNQIIWFGIKNDLFNTRISKLEENDLINKYELLELSQIFNFQTQTHPYSSNTIWGVIDEYAPIYLAIQWCLGRFYLLIYASRGNTDFADDLLYVHGIWEVELSEEFKKKIYPDGAFYDKKKQEEF